MTVTDDDIVDSLAAVVWGMNLDRDAHSIARDLVPVVRSLAPLVAPLGTPPRLPWQAPPPAPLSPDWWAGLQAAWDQSRPA